MTRERRELLLEKAQSIAEQTLASEAFEWVVIVNGDSDGTGDALESWVAEKRGSALGWAPRVTILREEIGIGVGAARNRAAQAAGGEFLYLSDDDCLLPPRTLARHLEAQQRDPGVWLGPVVFRADGSEERWFPGPRWWQVNGANTSFPTAAFHRAGGFDEALDGYGGEDLLLGYRLHRNGGRCAVIRSADVVHAGPNPVHGGDLTKARRAGHNAARIAEQYPELAYRLGVHPWVMAVKRILYAAPWSAQLARCAGGRFRYEQAYFSGASERREARQS